LGQTLTFAAVEQPFKLTFSTSLLKVVSLDVVGEDLIFSEYMVVSGGVVLVGFELQKVRR
jgi:hypothetical protein